MKKLIISLLITLVILSGCIKLNPGQLAKANEQVKEFLKGYPNAELTILYLDSETVASDPDFTERCPGVKIKDYYKVILKDPDSGLEALTWTDEKKVVCVFKEGSSYVYTTTTTTDKGKIKTGKGTLVMKITDKPVSEEITSVLVTITKIEVHKAGHDSNDESGASWITVMEDEKTYDLIEIKDVEEFLASEELDIGKYTQIRLYISNANITVDDEVKDLDISSNSLKLVNEFDIEEGRITELLLDFDVNKSVIQTGSRRYKLKPVIEVVEKTISTTTTSVPPPTTTISPEETTSTTLQEPTGPDIEFKVEAVYGNKGFSSGFIEACGKQVKSSDIQYCELNVNDKDADDFTCHITFSRHTIIPNEKYRLKLYGFNSGRYPGGYGYLKLKNGWKITEVNSGIRKNLLDPLYEIEVNSNYKTYIKFTDETIEFSSRSACIYCSLCDGSGIGRFEVIVEKTDDVIEDKKVVTFVIRHHMGGHKDSDMEFDCSGDLYHASGKNLVGVVFPESVSTCSYNLTVGGKTYTGQLGLTDKNWVELDINNLEEVITTTTIQQSDTNKIITNLEDAQNKLVEFKSDYWEYNKLVYPFCQDLSDAVFLIVHVDKEAESIECEWKDRYNWTEAIQESSPYHLDYLPYSLETLELLDECNSTTFEKYKRGTSQEWEKEEMARFNIIPYNPIPVTDFYVFYLACYDWNYDSESGNRLSQFIWEQNIIDGTEGEILTG